MKKILFFIALAALGYFAYYQYNKPVQSLADNKSDVQIEASSLLMDYIKNETDSDLKYLNKLVEVKGKVTKAEIEESGVAKIYMAVDSTGMVIFELEKAEENIKNLESSEISVKGLCTGFLMEDVIVTKASIVR